MPPAPPMPASFYNWNSGNAVPVETIVETSLGSNPFNAKPRKRGKLTMESLIGEAFGTPDPYVIDPSGDLRHYWNDILPKQPYQFVAPKTQVGIEVEVENIRRIDPNIQLAFWSVKEDGSLRNSGREFVTPGVIPVSSAELALKILFAGLNSNIDFSKRTSMHVHLDVRQLMIKQLFGLLFGYIAVENLLFKFVRNDRRSNIFCVPLNETGLMEHINGNAVTFLETLEHIWHKYTALNILPIAKFGSVEFRHMPGTDNVEHMLHWLDLISCLKVFAYKYPMEAIVEDIMKLNSNSRYQHFVESIFGDRCIYLDMANLLMDMEKPVYLIKNCAIANTFHKYVLENSNFESQLGRRISTWMTNLSAAQREALANIIVRTKRTEDPEWVFREVTSRPQSWIAAYGKDGEIARLIEILLKAPEGIAKKIKAKQIDPAIYQQILDNALDEADAPNQ